MEQLNAVDGSCRNISKVGTSFVVGVKNVESKVVARNLVCPDVVYVLHHEVPVLLAWCERSSFQQLDYQSLRSRYCRIGKFTYRIDLTVDRILVCYSQNLVGIELGVERNVTEL